MARHGRFIAVFGVLLLLGIPALFLLGVPRGETPRALQPERPGTERRAVSAGRFGAESPEAVGVSAGEEAAGGDRARILVRDLADGAPVSGIALVSPAGSECPTSVDGFAEVPAARLDALAIRPREWSIPKQTAAEIGSSGVLWVYRTMRVEGRAEDAAGPTRFETPLRIVANYSPGMPGDGTGASAAEPPWTIFWFREHGVPECVPSGCTDLDGGFDIEVPRIRHLYVTARAEDRGRSGTEAVAVDSRTESTSVRIVLRSSARVVGRILGHDGEPVPVKSLVLYSESRTTLDDFDMRELSARVDGSGLGVTIDSETGEVRIQVTGGRRRTGMVASR